MSVVTRGACQVFVSEPSVSETARGFLVGRAPCLFPATSLSVANSV